MFIELFPAFKLSTVTVSDSLVIVFTIFPFTATLNSAIGLLFVTDVFKVRSGEWTQVRIWSYVNLGTLKKEDLFVTNSRLEPKDNFTADFNYLIPKLDEEQEKKANKIIAKLNY